MRSSVNQASQAEKQAGSTSDTLGAEAQGIGANLVPFETARNSSIPRILAGRYLGDACGWS